MSLGENQVLWGVG
jgi:hypothetical protein